MGKKLFQFFKIWGNLVIFSITAYPFIVTYLIPSSVQSGDLTSLFGWSWQTWLVIFLVSIILTLLVQNLIEKYEDSKGTNPSSPQTNSADRNGIAMQGVKNSLVNSNNTTKFNSDNQYFSNSLTGYEIPQKENLLHLLGVEILRFEEQFKRVEFSFVKDRHNEIEKAKEILEGIKSKLLYHIKVALPETKITDLFVELENSVRSYQMNFEFLIQAEEERNFYLTTDRSYVPVILERIDQSRKVLGELSEKIHTKSKELISISQDKGFWTLSNMKKDKNDQQT